MKPRSRTRGHDFKLAGVTFKPNLRKYCFTKIVVTAWNRLPAQVVSQSTVNDFIHAWDKDRFILIQISLKKRGRLDDRPLSLFFLQSLLCVFMFIIRMKLFKWFHTSILSCSVCTKILVNNK